MQPQARPDGPLYYVTLLVSDHLSGRLDSPPPSRDPESRSSVPCAQNLKATLGQCSNAKTTISGFWQAGLAESRLGCRLRCSAAAARPRSGLARALWHRSGGSVRIRVLVFPGAQALAPERGTGTASVPFCSRLGSGPGPDRLRDLAPGLPEGKRLRTRPGQSPTDRPVTEKGSDLRPPRPDGPRGLTGTPSRSYRRAGPRNTQRLSLRTSHGVAIRLAAGGRGHRDTRALARRRSSPGPSRNRRKASASPVWTVTVLSAGSAPHGRPARTAAGGPPCSERRMIARCNMLLPSLLFRAARPPAVARQRRRDCRDRAWCGGVGAWRRTAGGCAWGRELTARVRWQTQRGRAPPHRRTGSRAAATAAAPSRLGLTAPGSDSSASSFSFFEATRFIPAGRETCVPYPLFGKACAW